jgi:hypothetical protein
MLVYVQDCFFIALGPRFSLQLLRMYRHPVHEAVQGM